MFSLHLMTANMLGYFPSKSNTIVNVDNYVMRACFKKTKLMNYQFYLHFFLLLEMQNIKSNEAKNIILDMYTCVPYG